MECPNCNKTFDDDFDLCPYCGMMSPILKACPECLYETLEEDIFCPKCSAKLMNKIQLIKDLKEKISDYKMLGEYEKVLECYDKTIELEPTNMLSWKAKANYLSGHARHDEALECWDKAIELNPTNSQYWVGKAGCLKKLARHEESGKCFMKARQLRP